MRFEAYDREVMLEDADGYQHRLSSYLERGGARYAARWRNLAGPLYVPLHGRRRRMLHTARALEKRRSFEARVEAGRRAERELLGIPEPEPEPEPEPAPALEPQKPHYHYKGRVYTR